VYLATLWIRVYIPTSDDVARIEWDAAIKPLRLDEILWEAFLPDGALGGPRQRLTRRINGAFIDQLQIGNGTFEAPAAHPSGTHLDPVIDEFTALRTDFVGRYPDVAGFLAADRATQSTLNGQRCRLREIVTLIALGMRNEAAAIADAELAQDNHGPYSSGHAGCSSGCRCTASHPRRSQHSRPAWPPPIGGRSLPRPADRR
jgi:hypothetical protein